MRRLLLIVVALFIFIFLLHTLGVANTVRQRRIEEEKRKVLQESERRPSKGEGRFLFDYGGWLNSRYIDYKDDDNDSAAQDSLDYTYSADFRFWFKATLKPPLDADYENEHFFYLRFKDFYEDSFPDGSDGGYDHDGPHLDYTYLILDLRPFWLEVGRRYFAVGRGIAYSNVNDGAQLVFLVKDWDISAFISHTLPHEDNIDTSIPGYLKKSDRFYYGIEAAYSGLSSHNLYAYFLLQRDFSGQDPLGSAQDYDYNSEYIGLGASAVLTDEISYWLEVIRETGKSRVFTTNEKKDIDAWAVDLGVSYDLSVYTHPGFSFEYAFGSGDSDRTNITDTQGGNSLGDDNNFLYFGYFPTGYALAPRLSNTHIYRVGVSFNPLERYAAFKRLTLGIDYYRYYKDRSSGGIYDLDASEDSGDIGSEINLNLSWQIFSDLRWFLQYGCFKPGDAYSDSANDRDHYLSLSMTVTF